MTRWQFPKHDEAGNIQCPHCGSHNWICWDEQYDYGDAGWAEDSTAEFDDLVERVVGYMKCGDCAQTWLDENPPFPLPAGYFPEAYGSWASMGDIPF